jgi:uncharacterized membrane protein YdbT with pleckstrin-like domain
MSYARTLLSRGEEVVFESRQHWFAVVAHTWGFIIAAILALAVAIWAASRPSGDSLGALGQIIEIAALLVLLSSLARIGLIIWAWRNQEWLVTNRRIIKAQGILNKSMGDSSLEKVNDAILSQSMIGRLVGYGNLEILTAAEEPSSVSDFPMLADAVQFKIAMLNQKHALEFPDEARPPVQRPGAPPQMQRPAPMPPRAGSRAIIRAGAHATDGRHAGGRCSVHSGTARGAARPRPYHAGRVRSQEARHPGADVGG